MKPEELLIIAESVYPDRFCEAHKKVCLISDKEGRLIYNPLTNKAQEMDLVRAYREKLFERAMVESKGTVSASEVISNMTGDFFNYTQMPETLCQAYLKLIKGEGEAS